MAVFWSYGGGTQSRALAAMILDGALPRPDIIAIADTGREVESTWAFIDQHLTPAGFVVHRIPHTYATVDLYRDEELLIPAYTRQSGRIGKMHTFCSNEWKQRACRRWLKDQGVTDCEAWIGISTDELERMKPSGLAWYRHVYPLIEIAPTSRNRCVELVKLRGWPVEKSRCWMCPNMSALDWRELRDTSPNEFAKAVKLDREIRAKDGTVYLHRAALPLVEAVEITDAQPGLFDGCDSGYCFV